MLAHAHREMEPTITKIVRILSDREEQLGEPVKLLEVNPATPASGIFPIAFSPAPPEVPFASIVVEVTENEYSLIIQGALPLPDGWRLGDELFSIAA